MSDWRIVYRGIRAKAARRLNNKRTNITEVKADSEYLVDILVQPHFSKREQSYQVTIYDTCEFLTSTDGDLPMGKPRANREDASPAWPSGGILDR